MGNHIVGFPRGGSNTEQVGYMYTDLSMIGHGKIVRKLKILTFTFILYQQINIIYTISTNKYMGFYKNYENGKNQN